MTEHSTTVIEATSPYVHGRILDPMDKFLDVVDMFLSPKNLEDKLLDPIDKFLDAVDEFLSPKHLENKWTPWTCYSAPIGKELVVIRSSTTG